MTPLASGDKYIVATPKNITTNLSKGSNVDYNELVYSSIVYGASFPANICLGDILYHCGEFRVRRILSVDMKTGVLTVKRLGVVGSLYIRIKMFFKKIPQQFQSRYR